MSDFRVRALRANEVARYQQLYERMRLSEGGHYVVGAGDFSETNWSSTVEKLASADQAFVAETVAGEWIGLIEVAHSQDYATLFVQTVWVDDDWRGRRFGVVDSLLAQAEENAHALGVTQLELFVNDQNERALGAYQRNQYQEVERFGTGRIVMRRNLPPEQDPPPPNR